MTSEQLLPLDGITVLDLSRLLPGGILARQLIDLGVRLIKIEEPGVGDPMRMVPPVVGGVGVGFAALLRGAESVCLDLTTAEGQARLRRLAARADVLVESFRPGTMASWGLGYDELTETNPRLVWCSLSSFGRGDAVRHRLAPRSQPYRAHRRARCHGPGSAENPARRCRCGDAGGVVDSGGVASA